MPSSIPTDERDVKPKNKHLFRGPVSIRCPLLNGLWCTSILFYSNLSISLQARVVLVTCCQTSTVPHEPTFFVDKKSPSNLFKICSLKIIVLIVIISTILLNAHTSRLYCFLLLPALLAVAAVAIQFSLTFYFTILWTVINEADEDQVNVVLMFPQVQFVLPHCVVLVFLYYFLK